MVRADRAREFLLRDFDVAGRLEHAVQTARGGRAFREEQVLSVELAHVANPVRLHDRLAARDRQRVERRDRAGGEALQVVEMRRGEAVADALKDVEVHFSQLFDFVENAPDHRGCRVTGKLLHFAIGQQVDVEFGAYALYEPRQSDADIARREARRVQLVMGCKEVAQQRHVVRRRHRNAVIDDDGFDLAVHDDAHHRVLETAHEHRLVNHRVLDAAQAAQLLGDLRVVGGGRCRDEQGFEVGPARIAAALRERHPVGHAAGGIVRGLPFAGVIAIAAREQRAAHASNQSPGAERVVAGDAFGQRLQQPQSGECEEVFERAHVRERRLDRGTRACRFAVARGRGPRLRLGVQLAPAIQARRRARKKVVQMGNTFSCHDASSPCMG